MRPARVRQSRLAMMYYALLLLPTTVAVAEETEREAATMAHVQALERAGESEPKALLRAFERERFAASWLAETTREERLALMREIHEAAKAAGGAMLDENDGELRLELMGGRGLVITFRVEDKPPYAITGLATAAPGGGLELTWDNVAGVMAELAENGFSGVLHLARDDETVMQEAYGHSNRELGYETKLDTVYGIGSTPIDFTVAGVYLLAQQDKLSLDDTVDRFFDGVPKDKRGLTVRHLISGQSGLPDFHDKEGDWDADLAWIDRDTAVRRILAQPMLFAPGESNAHSHSAYGLVASIIEQVSGKGYYQFLSEAFFAPADMQRTGMYGDARGLALDEFAVGYGPSAVGVPNIPPNWGPTSWLVLGSGGMYSTLGDMLRFYRFVQSDEVLEDEYARRMGGETVAVGGSERGFYFFYAANGRGNAAMLLMNGEGRSPEIRALSRALEALVIGP